MANGVRAIVPPQLQALGLTPTTEWGGRREFILGYIGGVALGICRALNIGRLSAEAALSAVMDMAGAFANDKPTVGELVGLIEDGRRAFLAGMAAGRADGLAWETTTPAAGLVGAFQSGRRTSPPGQADPSAEPAGTRFGKAGVAMRRLERYLVEHLPRVTLILCTALVLGITFQAWSTRHAGKTAIKEREEAEQAVGRDASNSAAILLGAYQKCRIVGVSDLHLCATHNGPFPQDRAAKAMAALALDYRARFDSSCAQVHSTQECLDLLSRALRITQAEEALEK
ncbi:hypothetical protein APY03_0901 [Variovorax sp. WDL1]|nr:hypothetical protein APY03_0901 [Variovorax sp. WDL1]